MEKTNALAALAGLSHETRLDIFRLLVEAGPAGIAAGQIGQRLNLAPATLSFHLSHLKHAGLVDAERDGRSLVYSADFERVRTLIAYLTENCCGGHPAACGLPDCEPAAAAAGSKARGIRDHEAPSRARRR
ncbi:MAG: ArsR/SmtB family transcription factor [Alphaproteobacteria bacterium]